MLFATETQGQPMDLFHKISVLQADFWWLGDLEEIICPWKESVAGEKTIQGVWGAFMCKTAGMCYFLEASSPLPPAENVNSALWPHPNWSVMSAGKISSKSGRRV